MSSASQQPETDVFPCGMCGEPVTTRWAPNGGGLLRGDYVLAGDVIFHPKCFDAAFEAFGQSASAK